MGSGLGKGAGVSEGTTTDADGAAPDGDGSREGVSPNDAVSNGSPVGLGLPSTGTSTGATTLRATSARTPVAIAKPVCAFVGWRRAAACRTDLVGSAGAGVTTSGLHHWQRSPGPSVSWSVPTDSSSRLQRRENGWACPSARTETLCQRCPDWTYFQVATHELLELAFAVTATS